ncbi:hypothetical protein ACIO1C_25045 [Streptomyces sp. NPDC087420]|uniref:hypothetical protein n=1 Tax=Streptomyces sp. NPDC087420 TaxID=3365785 RepID=UPI00383686B0
MCRAAPVIRRPVAALRTVTAPRAVSAARAARARRIALTALLVLVALLGMSLDTGHVPASAAEPRPPASAAPEPAGEGQQDPAESERTAVGRAAVRGGGAPAVPRTGTGWGGPQPTSYTRPFIPQEPSRVPAAASGAVLRC